MKRKKEQNKDLFPCVAGPKDPDSTMDSIYTLHAVEEFTFALKKNDNSVRHNHDNYVEITIVRSDKITHFLNGDKKKLSTGTVIFLLPGDTHRLTTSPKNKSETVNLTCYTATAERIAKTLFNKTFSGKKSCVLQLSKKQMETVNSFITQILSLADGKNASHFTASLFSYMLSIFFSQKEEEDTKDPRPEWLQKFLSTVSEMDFEYIKISELYKLSTYSQSVFSVQFRKYMGMTLIQYVTNMKFEYACNLLTKTNFTVLYICNKIGFTSLSHFNKQFRAKYGITPSEYRTKYANTLI